MIGTTAPAPWVTLDVLRTSTAAGLVSGLLSLADPALAALTGTLAILACAGCLERAHSSGLRRRWFGFPQHRLGVGALALGLAQFVGALPTPTLWRGAVLGVALVPLGLARP